MLRFISKIMPLLLVAFAIIAYSATVTINHGGGSDDYTLDANGVKIDSLGNVTVNIVETISEGNNGNPPVANFIQNITNITEGQSVSFTDTSSNSPNQWLWTFGDGSNSSFQNPSHQYNSPGTYSVSLKATNQYGNHTKLKNNLIIVQEDDNNNPQLCNDPDRQPPAGLSKVNSLPVINMNDQGEIQFSGKKYFAIKFTINAGIGGEMNTDYSALASQPGIISRISECPGDFSTKKDQNDLEADQKWGFNFNKSRCYNSHTSANVTVPLQKKNHFNGPDDAIKNTGCDFEIGKEYYWNIMASPTNPPSSNQPGCKNVNDSALCAIVYSSSIY